MLQIDVVTLFGPMFEAVTGSGVTGRARERRLYDLVAWNPRDFATIDAPMKTTTRASKMNNPPKYSFRKITARPARISSHGRKNASRTLIIHGSIL